METNSKTKYRIDVTMEQARTTLSVALLCDALDALGFRNQSPRLDFKPITCRAGDTPRMLMGLCKTTLWADMAHVDPTPYELELEAVDSCKADEVIVCAANGSMRSGIWGELLSGAARNAGCVGVLVDGAVRDIAKMRSMEFLAYTRGVSPLDSRDRQRVIDFDVPIEIGGVKVLPGDVVAADEDGVVFVPQSVCQQVLMNARSKAQAESKVRDAIKNGMSARQSFDTYGIL